MNIKVAFNVPKQNSCVGGNVVNIKNHSQVIFVSDCFSSCPTRTYRFRFATAA
jgi:hypothetical protein